jgi:hypothetical protein
MRIRWTAAILLAVAASAPVAAAEQDLAGQRQTIHAIRNVGTAMYAWLVDQPPVDRPKAEASDTIEWARCPAITHEEARALLVPTYMAELPANDGWGHPLELCIRRDGTAETPVIGIRSAGRDGEFDGDTYGTGAFEPEDQDRDVVWLDGYFVRWPQRKEG